MAKGSLSPALFLAVFLFFSEAVAATAENETDKVTASVITSSEKVNLTQDIDVLIRLQMHDDWHTYWSNPAMPGFDAGKMAASGGICCRRAGFEPTSEVYV